MTRSRNFYLDKHNAKVSGVCAGLANLTGVDALWWRIGTVLGTFFLTPFVLVAYFLVAWMADSHPVIRIGEDDPGAYDARREAVRQRMRDLERNARDMTMSSPRATRLSSEIDQLR